MRILLFILLFSETLVAQVKDRYNYVQRPTSTSVTIAWRTEKPGTSVIRWGIDSLNLKDSLLDENSIRKHVFDLEGLSSETKYYYQTETKGVFTSEVEYFITSKLTKSDHFSFLHYGDCGYNNTLQNDIAKLMKAEPVDFGIVAGDVDQGRGNNYDEVYFGVYKDLLKNTCHFTCIGNHDTYADKGQTYLDEFYLPTNNPQQTERYYSYEWGNSKFICLDSNIPYTQGTDQYSWLEDELKCNNKKWVFVFFHHPPWTNAWSKDYYIPFTEYFRYKGNKDMRTSLVPLFEQYKVDFVLNGHSHCYQRGEMNGVKYVISGGAGAKTLDKKKHSSSPNIDKEVYTNMYVRFDVKGDTVTYTAIDKEGTVIDKVKTVKELVPIEPLLAQKETSLVCSVKGKCEWFFEGVKIPEVEDVIIPVKEEGTYEVRVTDEKGCVFTSDPFEVE